MRACLFRRVDVFVAGLAQDETAALAPLVVEPQCARRARSILAFEPDLETADGERLIRPSATFTIRSRKPRLASVVAR
jgi:hypothetical protein